jgi:predicted dehydrogenase
MKAIVQNMKSGALAVDEVPPPRLRPRGVLVAVRRSLISLGTERSIINLAKKGPIGKAQDRPDLARKVINKARQEGFWSTYKVVRNLLESPIPLGYSCAGEVIAVGSEAPGFQVGDRVACAGLNFANHAEVDYVPRNLAVKMPESVSYDSGSFVAVGAIAMQGVRLANLELGSTVVVMGLGLVGQVAAQFARCSGATVIATDLDPGKVELAESLGAHAGAADGKDLVQLVQDMTDGVGADAVVICAATKSNDPIGVAVQACRLKGRVVLVGDVGLDLERRGWFEKECEFVVSRSYGPGRYDPSYEGHGQDYPLPYVRWTEGRNMRSFVDLVGRGEVDVESLVSHRFPIDEAESAYDLVTGRVKEPAIAIVLEYAEGASTATRVELPGGAAKPRGKLNVGVIGAGQFAKGVLLPAFKSHGSVAFRAVCTGSGLTSKHVAETYGAAFCTSDADEVIASDDVDTVVIATRHDHHAALVSKALRAGKSVFVEKPLGMTAAQVQDVEDAVRESGNDRLMVGFNRRFSPLALQCRDFFGGRDEPLFAFYRVNAGKLPADSWALDPVEGGGRLVGEGCHFVDLMAFLADAAPVRVFAQQLGVKNPGAGENPATSVTLTMADGSVGVVHYLGGGDTSVPKEYFEVFGGGRTAILDNYRTLFLHRDNKRRRNKLMNQAKGHAEEVAAFVKAVETGGPMPIDLDTLLAVSRATLLIPRSLEKGVPVGLADLVAAPEPEPEAEETGGADDAPGSSD